MKKWILFLSLFFIIIFWQSFDIYQKAVAPKKLTEKQAVNIARDQADLQTIQNVTSYYGNKSYSVVKGLNDKDEKMIVWVPQNGEILTIRKASSGISKEEAVNILQKDQQPNKIVKAVLGLEKGIPVWEITYLDEQNRYSFYYIDFQHGKFIKRYSLPKING